MRGRYHEHDSPTVDISIEHNHEDEDAWHEHWTNAEGGRIVYYPHLNKLQSAPHENHDGNDGGGNGNNPHGVHESDHTSSSPKGNT